MSYELWIAASAFGLLAMTRLKTRRAANRDGFRQLKP